MICDFRSSDRHEGPKIDPGLSHFLGAFDRVDGAGCASYISLVCRPIELSDGLLDSWWCGAELLTATLTV